MIVVRHGPTFADIEDGDLLPRLAKIGETRNKARLRFFDRRMAPTNWLRVYELTNGPVSPKRQGRHPSTSRNPAAADAATSLTVTTRGPNTDTALLRANTSTNFEGVSIGGIDDDL